MLSMMRGISSRFATAALAASLALAPAGAPHADGAQAHAVDPQTLGPKVGERLPDFSLSDQHGATRSLRSTFGPKGAVVVFYRSADW
jgi:hypothetical protein